MKTRVFLLLLLMLSVFIYAEKLEITVINVGQGDAIFIKAPNGQKIMIDAGMCSDADQIDRSNAFVNICNVLDKYGISKSSPLDILILTHYHRDHYSMIDNIVEKYGVPKEVIDRGGDQKFTGNKLADIPVKYMEAIKANRNPNGLLKPGSSIDLGEGAKMVLFAIGSPDYKGHPDKSTMVLGHGKVTFGNEIENAKSMVFVLSWRGFDVFLGGDSNEEVEHEVGDAIKHAGIDIDVYKVSHHGSRTSTEREFIEAIKPEVAICSTGHASAYKHPHRESYDNLFSHGGTFIYQTNEGYKGEASYFEPPEGYGILVNGNVTIKFDGKEYYDIVSKICKDRYPVDAYRPQIITKIGD